MAALTHERQLYLTASCGRGQRDLRGAERLIRAELAQRSVMTSAALCERVVLAAADLH